MQIPCSMAAWCMRFHQRRSHPNIVRWPLEPLPIHHHPGHAPWCQKGCGIPHWDWYKTREFHGQFPNLEYVRPWSFRPLPQEHTNCGHEFQPKNRLNQSTLATIWFTPSSSQCFLRVFSVVVFFSARDCMSHMGSTCVDWPTAVWAGQRRVSVHIRQIGLLQTR